MKHAPLVWIAALALLAGCETKPVAWEKSGASEATQKDDAQNCHTKARLTPSDRPKPPPSAYGATVALAAEDSRVRFEQEEFRRCMDEKGYKQGR